MLQRVCIFCGSRAGLGTRYGTLAADTGRALAQAGVGLVYGAGGVGLMGTLADAHLAAGGEVIGVIPEHLAAQEVMHHGLSQVLVVDSMHTRKARMAQLADAFVALPGGFGTLDELFEIVTWAQLGLHHKPVYLLNAFGFYDGLLAHFEAMTREGFIDGNWHTLLRVCTTLEDLVRALAPDHSVQRAHG